MEYLWLVWPVGLLLIVSISVRTVKKQYDLLEWYRHENRVLNEQLFEAIQQEKVKVRPRRRSDGSRSIGSLTLDKLRSTSEG